MVATPPAHCRTPPARAKTGPIHSTVKGSLKPRLSGSTVENEFMKAPGSSAIESYLPSTLLASVAGAPGVQAQLAAVLSIDIAGFTHISDVLLREHAGGA